MKTITKSAVIAAVLVVGYVTDAPAALQAFFGPPLKSTCDYSTPVTLKVVQYENAEDLKKVWLKLHPGEELARKDAIEGVTVVNNKTGVYTIHMLKIRGQEDFYRIQTFGHEAMHVFCGEWHPAD